MRYVLTLGLLVVSACPACRCQVLKLDGGTSSLLNADGAQATAYLPNAETFLGVGAVGGHAVVGAGVRFQYRHADVFLGDKPLSFGYVAVSMRGAAIERKTTRQTFGAFIGAVGRAYAAPYFYGTKANHFGAGVQYSAALAHGLKFSSADVLAANRKTALQSVAWRWRALDAQGTAGLLENRWYSAGNLAVHSQHLGAVADRVQLLSTPRATVNGVGIFANVGALDAHANVFQSTGRRRLTGTTYGVGLNLSAITVRADWYKSLAQKVAAQVLTERLGQRLALSQYFNESSGHVTAGVGASYTGNRITASVGYVETYSPLAVAKPWTRTLSVSVSIHIHDTSVSAQTITLPNGATKWTVSGSQYAYGVVPVVNTGRTSTPSFGKYVFRIDATDENGNAVEGVAVSVGKSLCVTDSHGSCFVRMKHKTPQSLTVLLDQFTAAGSWRVVNAPEVAESSAPSSVVVSRVTNPTREDTGK
jgi:hypothetical protein